MLSLAQHLRPLHFLDGRTLNNPAISGIGPQDCSVIDTIVTPKVGRSTSAEY